jgi:hypothetical protein
MTKDNRRLTNCRIAFRSSRLSDAWYRNTAFTYISFIGILARKHWVHLRGYIDLGSVQLQTCFPTQGAAERLKRAQSLAGSAFDWLWSVLSSLTTASPTFHSKRTAKTAMVTPGHLDRFLYRSRQINQTRFQNSHQGTNMIQILEAK